MEANNKKLKIKEKGEENAEEKEEEEEEEEEKNENFPPLDLDNIFEKISSKFKDPSDKYLTKNKLKSLRKKYLKEKNIINEKIGDNIFFILSHPIFYLELPDKSRINIYFLIKCNFVDIENNKKFSFWVCSIEYLKNKLRSMNYYEAKINKKELLSKNSTIKDNNNSSSESIDDKSDIETDLINYEIKVSKNPFDLEQIFIKSQQLFDPIKSFENIRDYMKDLNIQSIENRNQFEFNSDYDTDLDQIVGQKKNIYFNFYNSNSGLTLSLLQIFEQYKKVFNYRYFHFNSENLEHYKKHYLYFKLGKLFLNNDEDKNNFIKIFEEKESKNQKYNSFYIFKLLKKFLNKYKKKKDIFIIFDNIKNNDILSKILLSLRKLEFKPLTNDFSVLLFIEINPSTMSSINNLLLISNNIKSLLPNEDSFNQDLPLMEYLKTRFTGNQNLVYKENLKNELNKLKDDTIEYLIFIIQLLHKDIFIKNNSFRYYNGNNYLNKFLPYLFVSFSIIFNTPFINKIKFRSNFFREIIQDHLNYLMSKFLVTDIILKDIKNKSTEGIYIEKEIIYYLITKYISFEKLKIEKIYCFNSKINKNYINSDLIIIQTLDLAPLYDFGIIKFINGEPIFKGYQIGINKPYQSLLKLYKDKIKLDSLYFISKINQYLNKKITKFTFGIITTLYAYKSNKKNKIVIEDNEVDIENFDLNEDIKEEEKENNNNYKNYNSMKNYCDKNKYEFLIFDPENNNFYIDNGDDLTQISFDIYNDQKFENSISNYLFTNESDLNISKLPLHPKEISETDKTYIYNTVSEIKNKQLIFIGKFMIEKKNDVDFKKLINENYLIYSKDNWKKTIFYKNEYICNDFQDSNIIYIFDTTLNLNKKSKNTKNDKQKNKIKQNENIECENEKSEKENKLPPIITKKKKKRKNKNNYYLKKKTNRDNNENQECEKEEKNKK